MRTLYSLFQWFTTRADSVPQGTFGNIWNTWRHFLFLWLGEGVLLISRGSCQHLTMHRITPQQKIVFSKISIALRLRNLVLQSSWVWMDSDLNQMSEWFPLLQYAHFRCQTVASIKIMAKVAYVATLFMDQDLWTRMTTTCGILPCFKSRIMLNQS